MIKLGKSTLLDGLRSVQGAAHTGKEHMLWEGLQGVKIEALLPDQLILTCFNGEVAASQRLVTVNQADEWQVLVPVELLTNWVKTMPKDGIIGLQPVGENNLKVTCGRCRMTLEGWDPEQFPQVAQVGDEVGGMAAQGVNIAIGRTTGVTADHNDPREALQTVRVIFTPGGATLVGCDGIQLVIQAAEYEGDSTASYNVPVKALEMLRAATKGYLIEADVVVSEKDKKITFVVGDLGITSPLVEGNYPDYEAIIPASTKTVAVQGVVLWQALKACLPFCTMHAVRAKVLAVGPNVVVSDQLELVWESEVGSIKVQVPVQAKGFTVGDEYEIVLNGRHLEGILSKVKAHEVTLGFQDPLSSYELRVSGDDSFRYVGAPMFIR